MSTDKYIHIRTEGTTRSSDNRQRHAASTAAYATYAYFWMSQAMASVSVEPELATTCDDAWLGSVSRRPCAVFVCVTILAL